MKHEALASKTTFRVTDIKSCCVSDLGFEPRAYQQTCSQFLGISPRLLRDRKNAAAPLLRVVQIESAVDSVYLSWTWKDKLMLVHRAINRLCAQVLTRRAIESPRSTHFEAEPENRLRSTRSGICQKVVNRVVPIFCAQLCPMLSFAEMRARANGLASIPTFRAASLKRDPPRPSP
jgi:hypothetical protein